MSVAAVEARGPLPREERVKRRRGCWEFPFRNSLTNCVETFEAVVGRVATIPRARARTRKSQFMAKAAAIVGCVPRVFCRIDLAVISRFLERFGTEFRLIGTS